jgi:hypothetical protein
MHMQAKKEAELRELAMRARMERAGGLASRIDGSAAPPAMAGGAYVHVLNCTS